jgi:uncharacterized protein YndB with AHSA1/START domain/DNA-binding transcriptional ArsR family regulator
MEVLLAALSDPVRWRLVALLAERPRPVGVLAQLAGARQPQTTKHLQTLERAGVVVSQRSGQRRIYALRPDVLRDAAGALTALAEAADRATARATFGRYGRSLSREREAAREAGWADGRAFRFSRSLAARPEVVWRHLTEATLLARWWTPDDLRVSELVFDAWPGGQILHEYRDVEDVDGSDVVVGRAQGEVVEASPGEHLAYRLSPVLPDGRVAFTAHVDMDLRPVETGTALDVRFLVADSTVDSADFVAGIEIGFGQSLDTLVATVTSPHDPHTTDSTGSAP